MPKGSQNGCIVLFCFVAFWMKIQYLLDGKMFMESSFCVVYVCVLLHVLGLSTLFGFDLHHFSFPYLSLAHQDSARE